ncbi:hypothetical protein LCGC14_2117020 [marine sediment metagenome]|uniref:Tail tubular protein A n=1 Tax=marine sediment metagenome TaxID=412755 RepID=A0A0F9E5F1_9ZZZZ
MVSTVDVINVALRRVGAARVVSLTDDSAEAVIANDLFSEVLDDLLRQHAWNFAIRRAKLAQLVDEPTFEFDHAYTMPANWIRTVSVHPNSEGAGTMFYREEQLDDKRVILTSTDEVYMRYVARVTDPNLWSADFRNAVSMTLARDFAIPLGNSNTLHANFDKLSRGALARARSTDAMGSSPERLPRGSWVTRRGVQRPIIGDTTT